MLGTLKKIVNAIREFHKRSNIPVLESTSVISPLYPGQFCYCLDEIQWYEKYGDFINIAIGEDFQKIQPAIRLRDFESFYLGAEKSSHHLGLFTIATISGGKVVSNKDAKKEYEHKVSTFLNFLSSVGLDLSKLKVTYFSGNTSSNIEMSRKKETQERKILIDEYIPMDDFKDTLIRCGLMKDQLEGVDTRDNYLTSNWYNMVAPWGYRNEFLYLMPDGSYLDIGTIERLNTKPIVEKVDGDNSIVGLEKWDRTIIIDAIGIERIILAIEKTPNVSEISLLLPLECSQINDSSREALKILHRVFTDCTWNDLSRHKKERVKLLMRICNDLSLNVITDFLQLHATQYKILFPELSGGVERTLQEISNYRKRIEK